jgi:hypothetical protein
LIQQATIFCVALDLIASAKLKQADKQKLSSWNNSAIKSFLVSSSMVCSENIDNRGSERFTPLVLIEMGNAGRLDKVCLGVLSRGGA